MKISIQTKLAPNNIQRTLLAKSAGTARFAYNWGLGLCQQVLQHNKLNPDDKIKFPSSIDLHKLLNASVKPEHPWFYEVSKSAPQFALRHLAEAFKRFFKMPETGFPNFKKKGIRDSFTVDGSVEVGTNFVKIPRIGKVRTYEALAPFKPSTIAIKKIANDWFVSFSYEVEFQPTEKPLSSVGVDLGLKSLATLSSEQVVEGPKSYRQSEKRLQQLQRRLSRKVKGSKNRDKARQKVTKLHAKVASIRLDSLHKLTTMICKNHAVIGIEELNVSGMLANRKLAQAIGDMGFYEFKRQLTYKSEKFGNKLVLIDRWFPSSKKCSCCGHIKSDLTLSDRIYECSECGLVIDRDLNAAQNIEQEALRILALESA